MDAKTVKLLLALVLLASTLAGCSSKEPEPERDVPRYSAKQVQRAVLASPEIDRLRPGCLGSQVEYEGDGLWTCGLWTFDEQTGRVFRK